jgi:ATP-dependent helicase/nuclease subunit B
MASTQHELQLIDGGDQNLRGKLFTIPPLAPFLETLARAIRSGHLPRPGGKAPSQFELTAYEIYLPNRAACRALTEVFLRISERRATFLPRIRPLGAAEEDSLLLLQDDLTADDLGRPNLPVAPAIGALDRRMALTGLVLAWARQLREGRILDEAGLRIADTPAAAAELALELMRLMDEAETERVDLRQLASLLPERFAGHEQLSLSFLNIVMDAWPAFLAENGVLNPVDRRNKLMALEAERLRNLSPETPVIVAGSTGSIPATADLMKAVARLPNGAIVLPGVDLGLDEASWDALAGHPEHPQAGLFQLLSELGGTRGDVLSLQGAETLDGGNARVQLISEALRPGATLHQWPDFTDGAQKGDIRRSLEPASLIAAPTEQDEAAAIALILREAIETPDKTANLVTPDRTLARRVAAELARWGLQLEGSSGEPLLSTQAGIFFDLIADAVATGSQITVLALLKHAFTRLGLKAGDAHAAMAAVEIAGMRQVWCGKGVNALRESLDLAERTKWGRHPAVARLSEDDWGAAFDLVRRLAEALEPLGALDSSGPVPLNALASAHTECAARLTADETGACSLLSETPDGLAMSAFLGALADSLSGPRIALADYPALFRSLIRLETVRIQRSAHPRLQILQPMEARLTSADLVIIAGLNEGTWPETADPGPWLNRAMREALGLPPPERKTRLAGHDFWQMMGAPQVVLTRALKSGGTPTVPSRWLMRLQALLSGLGLEDALRPPQPWLAWAATRNAAAPPPPAKAPAPCPPLAARPRSLSVSDIETLIANPYAIYAKHILALRPVNPLDAEPGGAERGQIIHEVLRRFSKRFPAELPRDPARLMLAIFNDCAALYGERAQIEAFWRPRMERFAAWFAETEAARRDGAHVLSERVGQWGFEAPGGLFTLSARADRIDLRPDGGLAIYDYKSGSIPSEAAVIAFKAPQLPLEALIAREGSFEGLPSRKVDKLVYISAKGGDPAGEERILTKQPPERLAEDAREGLIGLIAHFDLEATPYTAMRRAAFSERYRYDPYAHLARVAEWAGAEDDG